MIIGFFIFYLLISKFFSYTYFNSLNSLITSTNALKLVISFLINEKWLFSLKWEFKNLKKSSITYLFILSSVKISL